jgi:hypothetical protein
MDYGRDDSMSTRVNKALAELEERARRGCPGWETWVIATHDKRLLWSARPDGAAVAVIAGEASAGDLVEAVAAYTLNLPARLEAARRELASVPHTNIGRDRAAVLSTLVAALEKLAAGQAEAAGEV